MKIMCLIHKLFFQTLPEGFIKFSLLLKRNYTQAHTDTHTCQTHNFSIQAGLN